MYSKLAGVYEALYPWKDYAGESAYVAAVIRERHPAARTLLETASGTGNYLEYFRRDWQVEGLDASEEMLEKGRKRFADIPMHYGDMSDFDLQRRYDVVCCLFRGIGHCRTGARMRSAIAAMARHVAPGGLLLIEPYFTPDTFRDGHVALNRHETGDMKFAWMYVQKREGLEVRMDVHCLVGTSEGVSHFTELLELGLYTHEQLRSAFADAGLPVDFDPVGPTGTGLFIGRQPR